ncbi:amino acid ABC transporter ATP-binding/permease protein [Streptococcus hongkongensis]|nr:ABC transporter ATP-binding protein [Streptococcus uberis]
MLKSVIPSYKMAKRLLSLMKELLPFIALAVIFAVMGFVVTLTIPVALVRLGLASVNGQFIPVYYYAVFIGLALLRGLCRYGEHYFGHYVAFHTLAKCRGLLYQKLRRLTPQALDQKDSGQLLKMIGEDIEALEIFFAHTIAPICTGLLSALLIFIVFASFNILLAIIALFTYSLLALVIPYYFADALELLLAEQTKNRKRYASFFIESLQAMKDLLQFQLVNKRFLALNQLSQSVNGSERKIAQKQYMQFTVTFFVLGLGLTLFTFIDFYLMRRQALSFQEGIPLLVAFSASFAPFLELGRLPLGFKRAMHAGDHLFSILDEREPELSGNKQLERLDTVSIDNLNFTYPNSERVLYYNLSGTFSKNGIIAIQGESGSGKSTLMKLIMRWYAFQSGHIYLQNQTIQELNPSELQNTIAYLPQHAQLFYQSIRDNLTLGREDISDEAIWNLAERCGLKKRLLSCPQGLDTIISDPNMFSAGERQRLELMRALLKEAECYIFDEPTSHLDSLNESLLLSIIKKECHGLVFLISHRRSTLAYADQIFQLDQGQLKEIQKNE